MRQQYYHSDDENLVLLRNLNNEFSRIIHRRIKMMHAGAYTRKNQVWVGRIALAGRGGSESRVWLIMP